MIGFIEAVLLIGLLILLMGSLLSLSDSAHWFIRSWDFPRVQIIVTAWMLTTGMWLCWEVATNRNDLLLWSALFITGGLTAWHGFRIFPYTPIAPKQAVGTRSTDSSVDHPDAADIRIVISNVEMENDEYELWMKTVREVDPDVLIVLEPDQVWVEAIGSLIDDFPERVIVPQANWYGMMLLSKLPMPKHQVRYLVQDDIPSIDAEVRLPNGQTMRVVAVHPRPPEPIRGNDATARDAELTLWGKEFAKETRPAIIGGDLNDVAWSATTRLFLRTSEMLDPRRGRGMFNTFHAKHVWMRYPLDHVFVSPHFTISDVRRLPYIGSDHFPIQIDLRYAPDKQSQHDVLTQKPGDEEKIEEKIERAVEHPETNGEAVDVVETCSQCDAIKKRARSESMRSTQT